MHCIVCNGENREGRRFCSECGAPLASACPQCGFANQADDKFCGGCGAPLSQDPQPSPLPATEEAAPTGERRHLTVMFCDLVGSTALAEKLDPEELGDAIRAFQAACAETVGEFDGFIARYMGDGMLVYFGYPLAHEDSAERAVRAGLAVVKAVGRLPPAGGTALAVRVGIATGLVVAGENVGSGAAAERVVHGETPNLAARLQNLAMPDRVVIAAATRRLVDPMFVIEDLGRHLLKGLSTAVPAYRVVALKEVPSRFEAADTARLTPMVGRQVEIALLLDRWRRARDGEGQVVMLSGEPGLGKSRITRSLRDSLESEPHDRILCYCSPYFQNSAFHPVAEQLKRRMGFAKEDPVDRRFEKIEAELDALGLPVGDYAPVVAHLLSLPAGERYPSAAEDPEVTKRKTLSVMSDIVAAATRQGPILLTVEDLHWIDPSSLECLGQLIERVPALPVLVLLTYRPEFQPPWSRRGHVTELSLSRLSRSESRAIVGRLSGEPPLPDSVIDEIVEKTDGVPLFVEELTKTVLESDPGRAPGAGDRPAGPAPLAIPASLQDSLMARLDHLAPAKEVAQFAATLGRRFSHEVLYATAPFAPAFLDDAIRQLVEAGLIYRRGLPPDARYEFKHALVQDTAYQSLLKSRRRQFHAQIANALLEGVGGLGDADPSLLAHHFTEAGLPERAAPCWLEAGREAIDRFANQEAVAHLRRGLDVLAELPESDDRVRWEVEMNLGLATAMRVLEHLDDAFAALEAAQQAAGGHALTAELSRIHHMRGNLCFPLARVDDCRENHELALKYARAAESVVDEARALGGLGDAAYAGGRMRTANRYFRQCVELSRENGFTYIAAANHNMVAFTLQYLLKIEDALAEGLAAIESARAAGHQRAELLGETIVYNTLSEMGRPVEAKPHLERSREIEDRIGARRFMVERLVFEAQALTMEGKAPRARSLLEEALNIARQTGMSFIGPWVLAELAKLSDTPADRNARLAEAEQVLARGAVSHSHFWFYREAIDCCLTAGDPDSAERYADDLAAYSREEPLPWSDFFTARGRALAAFARGRRDAELIDEIAELRRCAAEAPIVPALAMLDAALKEGG